MTEEPITLHILIPPLSIRRISRTPGYGTDYGIIRPGDMERRLHVDTDGIAWNTDGARNSSRAGSVEVQAVAEYEVWRERRDAEEKERAKQA